MKLYIWLLVVNDVFLCADVKSSFAVMRKWNPKGPLVSDLLQISVVFTEAYWQHQSFLRQ